MRSFIRYIHACGLLVIITVPSFLMGMNTNMPKTQSQQTVIEDTSNVSPQKFDENFKDRYTSSDYKYEQEKSEGWLGNFIDWLEKSVQDLFNLGSRQEASNFIDDMINIFYVLVVILVVFFIVKALMNGEGRWVFGKRSDKKGIRHEDIATDIYVTNFQKLIEDAVNEGNYRYAIRYHYLDMLKKMSTAGIISYDPDKTNFDYASEITDPFINEQFLYTSYLYNYIWYGEFTIDQQQYEKAASSFTFLLKNMAA